MGVWAKIKSVLPVSSRSFHAFEAYANNCLERIDSRQQDLAAEQANVARSLELAQHSLNQARQSLSTLEGSMALSEEKARLRFEAMVRDSHPNETPFETRCRIFRLYPEAEGEIRLSQLANAAMMNALDRICRDNGIDYWFAYGTLIATLGRSGSIPWDDDIDICMMRSDIVKLKELLSEDPDWRVTLVYDRWAHCKQYRFRSTDSTIPCFIDLSVYDWADISTPDSDAQFKSMRLSLMDELRLMEASLPYWSKRHYLFERNSEFLLDGDEFGLGPQESEQTHAEIEHINQIFDKYQKQSQEAGILTDEQHANAVAYAIDNIYDAPWRRTLWRRELIFPTVYHPYESYSFRVPNQAKAVADECYPGWPYLPSDILGHNHFSKDLLHNAETQEKLTALIHNG